MSHPAYLLVAHGSRDPRPALELAQLAQNVAQCLPTSHTPAVVAGAASRAGQSTDARGAFVATAFLELQPRPLHQEIVAVAQTALAQGYDELCILPLFLLPGTHVMEDIPAEVAIARQALAAAFPLRLCPHFGSSPNLSQNWLSVLPAQPGGRILLAHGSRRLGGNAPVETLAAALGAVPAFWAVEPGLTTQVAALAAQGVSEITLLPYFLFPGGITDAIAQQQQALAARYPAIRFHQVPPLSRSVPLAQWVADWITNAVRIGAASYHPDESSP